MMTTSPNLAERFRQAFLQQAQRPETCQPLKDASLSGRLGDWTKALTICVVSACRDAELRAAAKAHIINLLPVSRGEYLGLDVMAFAPGRKRWLFPTVVIELENSAREDVIAYSLWKTLCVRADLRLVFCYRRQAAAIPRLLRHLSDEVVEAMELGNRVKLKGHTIVAVGSRAEAETFPYGFFSWWELDTNTGQFLKI
ncbi:MAG TPA: hypothetical protein VFA51_07240 [Candidatus Udaeobacter sp.]|nr:hypothetical protein [Candidatus Udaeobacter sp.]